MYIGPEPRAEISPEDNKKIDQLTHEYRHLYRLQSNLTRLHERSASLADYLSELDAFHENQHASGRIRQNGRCYLISTEARRYLKENATRTFLTRRLTEVTHNLSVCLHKTETLLTQKLPPEVVPWLYTHLDRTTLSNLRLSAGDRWHEATHTYLKTADAIPGKLQATLFKGLIGSREPSPSDTALWAPFYARKQRRLALEPQTTPPEKVAHHAPKLP